MASTLVWFFSLFRQGVHPPSPNPPPTAYTFPVSNPEDVVQSRSAFLKQRTKEAPSNGAEPSKFFKKQKQADRCIPCDRPHGSNPTMPLDLLHPIFGDFKDHVKDRVPTPSDIEFSLDFMVAMSDHYEDEGDRQAALFKVFKAHKIPLRASKLGKYSTDGDRSVDDFMYLIVEIKNELGSGGRADLLLQALLYYLESTRGLAARHHNSVLPCILVLVFGASCFLDGGSIQPHPS